MKRELEKELIAWKERTDKMPLLLRGAKQVGKSTLIEHFGKTHFKESITLDFRKKPAYKRLFTSHTPAEILQQIEQLEGKRILPGQTLLFLDHIEECPEALALLRHFPKELHLIAAKAHLSILFETKEKKFPLSGLAFAYLRPLSFQEFLQAVDPSCSSDHSTQLNWIRTYLVVGGMPSAVQAYVETRSFTAVRTVQQQLLQVYENTLALHTSRLQSPHARIILHKAPPLVGEVLKYVNIDPETRSRTLKSALRPLTAIGLFHQAFATPADLPTLHTQMRDHRFKLFHLDVGLLQTACEIPAEKILNEPIEGILAEQFVAQELLAYSPPKSNKPLLYWERESGGEAEVDFVTQVNGQIVPIDVKAGAVGSLRALKSFLTHKQAPLAIRIAEHPLSQKGQILSVPFYLISRLSELVSLAKK